MTTAELWRALFVLGPIIGLLAMGLVLTIRSGVVDTAGAVRPGRVVENVSHMAALTVMCLVALAALQQLVGFRMAMLW